MNDSRSLVVGVMGSAGYAGGELLRLLSSHPQVRSIHAYSSSQANKPWSSLHPHFLNADIDPLFRNAQDLQVAELDVLFLAQPHGVAQTFVAQMDAFDGLIVDLSADFRVQDRQLYEEYYDPHVAPEILPTFRYGLADISGARLAGAKRIASPGCFATAALLALYPLCRFASLERPPVCFAATGSTGSGASAKATTHHPTRAHNFYGYSPAGHRHQAEIDECVRRWTEDDTFRCGLLTHSAPMVRGISATVHAWLAEPVDSPNSLFVEAYAAARFIKVLEQPPRLNAVTHTNFAHVCATKRGDGREVVVQVCIDNLVKGASGQAIQSMNLSLGLDESAGLNHQGASPC